MNKKITSLVFTILMVVCSTAFSALSVFAGTSQTISASHRLEGRDRYATAAAVSQKGWVTSDTVVIASGDNYADALTAGPLAQKYNSPVILAPEDGYNPDTISEIERLKPTHLIIVGGEGAIKQSLVRALNQDGFKDITRIGGLNRYETSAMVAAKLNKPSAVVIASGQNFPDALSVSSVASKLGYPILLSDKNGLSDSVKKYIAANPVSKSYVVGGLGVLSSAIDKQVTAPTRLAGIDRYATNLVILKAFEDDFNYDNVFIATGNDFADALAGSALASKTSSPLVLAGKNVSTDTSKYLISKEDVGTKIFGLGDEGVLSNSIVKSAIDDKATISVTKNYSSKGTYSDENINGSATISAAGVMLKNITITGDLLIASTIGEGNVDLDNVTVNGKIIINGGGSNSVKLYNMNAISVELDKAIGESVRIATDATYSIDSLVVSSRGIVDQTSASKIGSFKIDNNASVVLMGGFGNVQVNGRNCVVNLLGGSIASLHINAASDTTVVNVDATSTISSVAVNSNVLIDGTGVIVNVTVDKPDVKVTLRAISVGTVLVSAEASGSKVNVSSITTVSNLNVHAPILVGDGNGTVTNANIGVNGTTIWAKTTTISVTKGVSVTVNGAIKDSTNSTVIVNVPVGEETVVPLVPVVQ